MIYITGDLHGSIDISKLNSKNLRKKRLNIKEGDYLIILGDFGLVWDNSKMDLYWRRWLNDKPWTTVFIDGNHENFNLLYEFELEERFGGMVHKIDDNIYHLNRGEIYIIEDKKFFVFGGAESIDKNHRKENKSWWKQEMPTRDEMEHGIDNLEKCNYQIEYVLTHTCPADIFADVVQNDKNITSIEIYLSFIKTILEQKEIDYKWYFGHFHKNQIIKNKFICLYDDIRYINRI